MQVTKRLMNRNADSYGSPAVTIVCLGDSVTHGCFGVRINRAGNVDTEFIPDKSYARKLEDMLYRLYPVAAVNVINAGISGDSASGALKRFDRDVARYAPDLVVVNLGLNDCMGADAEQALSIYVSSMKSLFQKISEIGAECILLTPNMMCKYVDPALKEELLRSIADAAAERQNAGTLDRFVDAARDAAASMGVPIADAYAVWQKYAENGVDTTQLLSNFINHPVPEMHDVFASKVLEVMMR